MHLTLALKFIQFHQLLHFFNIQLLPINVAVTIWLVLPPNCYISVCNGRNRAARINYIKSSFFIIFSLRRTFLRRLQYLRQMLVSPHKVARHDREVGWLVSAEGVARGGGAIGCTGRCQLKKKGRRSSRGPTQGLICPGGVTELHQRSSGKRKEPF